MGNFGSVNAFTDEDKTLALKHAGTAHERLMKAFVAMGLNESLAEAAATRHIGAALREIDAALAPLRM